MTTNADVDYWVRQYGIERDTVRRLADELDALKAAQPPQAAPASERERFEAKMKVAHPEWSFTADPVFDYHNERTRCAWEGWRVGRAVLAALEAAP
jgi:hypothetical protein